MGWLAAQPWCNGNVGTFGCSYPCEVQYLQAPLRHPQLKCMIPQNGPALGAANGRYRYWSGYKGGVMDWAASYPWYADAGSKYTYQPPPGLSDDEIREMRRFYDPTPSQWEEPDFEQVSTAAGTTFSLAGLRFHTDGAVFQTAYSDGRPRSVGAESCSAWCDTVSPVLCRLLHLTTSVAQAPVEQLSRSSPNGGMMKRK